MGSKSDWETMRHADDVLDSLRRAARSRTSYRRTARRSAMAEFASTAESRGLEVIIAGAGGAAHLPGMVAAHTLVPVLGVPVESHALKGMDSLLSIVQMPGGIPVGTLAIGKAGAANAALLAVAILANSRPELRESCGRSGEEQTPRFVRTRSHEADPSRRHRRRARQRPTRPDVRDCGSPHGLSRPYVLARERHADRAGGGLEITASVCGSGPGARVCAQGVAVVTFEFENVPAETAAAAAEHAHVRPAGTRAAHDADIGCARRAFCVRRDCRLRRSLRSRRLDDLRAAVARQGCPAILKTADSDTTAKARCGSLDAEDADARVGRDRPGSGGSRIVRRFRVRGIGGGGARAGWRVRALRRCAERAPQPDPGRDHRARSGAATRVARMRSRLRATVLEKLDVVGVLCVEFFLTRNGAAADQRTRATTAQLRSFHASTRASPASSSSSCARCAVCRWGRPSR